MLTHGKRLRTVLVTAAVLLPVALWAPAAGAQSYEMRWHTVDGGGGAASSGSLELEGTVGQPDAGVLSGGNFQLQGGFWPAFAGRGCDVDGDGDRDAVDLAWIVACHPDPATCGCPGDPDRNRDSAVDGDDTVIVLAGAF